jgi:ssDNA-binding Zn-finger/Zn-ribbon topoisomerase 1
LRQGSVVVFDGAQPVANSKEDHRCPKCGRPTRLVTRRVDDQFVADRECDECNFAIERPSAPEDPAICRICGKPIRDGEARYHDFEGDVHADCREKAPPPRRRR